MKGIIFNLLEEVVSAELGDRQWDALLDGAGVDGAYTSLGNYADAELAALLTAYAAASGRTPPEALRSFGRQSMPIMAERYPTFFANHKLRSFLLSVNDVIHFEVRKLYPDAHTPEFQFETPPGMDPERVLRIHYRSERRLCRLAEGFIEGAADVLGESVEVSHLTCVHGGDAACALECTFGPKS